MQLQVGPSFLCRFVVSVTADVNPITIASISSPGCLQDDGSKRTIRSVFRRLKRIGYDVETIWRDIGRMAVKTIIAILPELKVEHEIEISNVRPGLSCFQVNYMYNDIFISFHFVINVVVAVYIQTVHFLHSLIYSPGRPRTFQHPLSGGVRWGLGGLTLKMSLSPTVKHTGQESGGELCQIFKFWSFL